MATCRELTAELSLAEHESPMNEEKGEEGIENSERLAKAESLKERDPTTVSYGEYIEMIDGSLERMQQLSNQFMEQQKKLKEYAASVKSSMKNVQSNLEEMDACLEIIFEQLPREQRKEIPVEELPREKREEIPVEELPGEKRVEIPVEELVSSIKINPPDSDEEEDSAENQKEQKQKKKGCKSGVLRALRRIFRFCCCCCLRPKVQE